MTTSVEGSSLAELRLLIMDLMLSVEPFLCGISNEFNRGASRGTGKISNIHLKVSTDEELARHGGGNNGMDMLRRLSLREEVCIIEERRVCKRTLCTNIRPELMPVIGNVTGLKGQERLLRELPMSGSIVYLSLLYGSLLTLEPTD